MPVDLPSSLTTVTKFTKFLAIFIFMTIVVTAYLFGSNMGKLTSVDIDKSIHSPQPSVDMPVENSQVEVPKVPTIIVEAQKAPSGWKEYRNSDVGFSFYYPPMFDLMESSDPVTQNAISTSRNSYVYVCIEPWFDDPEELEKYRSKYQMVCRRLSVEDGPNIDHRWGGFSESDSRKVIKAGNIMARTETVFSMFEVCDVQFNQILAFNKNNFHVEITVGMNVPKSINENPEYFTRDESNCGTQLVWNFDQEGPSKFYNALNNKTSSKGALQWYTSFDTLVSTLKEF